MPRKPISFELDFMIKDIFPRFTVKQFDDVSFNIKPKNQGLDYDTTGMTGKIFVGVNNDMFMQTTGITVSNNNINILLDRNMLQKQGRAYAEVELTDSNGTITSSSFIFDIDPKIGEGGQIPGEYEGFVEKYERLISEFKSQVNTTINNCNTNVDNKLNTVDSLINVKISDFEKRFNRLISSQQQDAEVVDARDGETSLKARLDRDIEKAKQVYINVEGSNISTDSSSGYLKDVEILGNTIQDENNLADIRSVGDKVEGQELYKIPVLSCGKNINSSLIKRGNINANTGIEESGANTILCTENFIPAKPETIYAISSNISIGSILLMCYNENKEYLGYCNISNEGFKTKLGTKYVKFRFAKSPSAEFTDLEVSTIKVQLEEGTVVTEYTTHQSDKKRLLYYNEETQSWEKPILREWDSIEKHANGKYYYHQRSAEVVLNGSESWYSISTLENVSGFGVDAVLHGVTDLSKIISDRFSFVGDDKLGQIRLGNSGRSIFIYISNTELSTQDIQGFKQWLQANNVTVVYQLAEEKVYECTNIDLITYANETNYIVESGAISPKTTLKVHSNISNVVSLLQKKVSLLESDITSYMITQNRLMLASRYNADTVSFKVDVATLRNSFEYDNDLYELILNNILVGKDNYDREYIENLIIFYWMDFVISDEMYFTLFEIIEGQHDPKVIEDEEAPL